MISSSRSSPNSCRALRATLSSSSTSADVSGCGVCGLSLVTAKPPYRNRCNTITCNCASMQSYCGHSVNRNCITQTKRSQGDFRRIQMPSPAGRHSFCGGPAPRSSAHRRGESPSCSSVRGKAGAKPQKQTRPIIPRPRCAQIPHLRHSRERGNPSPTGCASMTPQAVRHAGRPHQVGNLGVPTPSAASRNMRCSVLRAQLSRRERPHNPFTPSSAAALSGAYRGAHTCSHS